MLVKELFCGNFDFNCDVSVYDCRKGGAWYTQNPVYEGFGAPGADDIDDEILNSFVSYVTTNDGGIVIEAC